MPRFRTNRRCDFQFLVPHISPAYAAIVFESLAGSIRQGRQAAPTHTLETGAERRKARRFVLEIPVLFRWMDDGQRACEGAGFCRDISTSGVFVISCSAAPPLARKLDLVVLLPSLSPAGPAMQLCSTGSVVRVEPIGKGVGLGIASAFSGLKDSKASSFPEEKSSAPCS
jgi:hypothetical protein